MTDKTFDKYKLVIDEYFINGFNGTKAYQSVYPKSSPSSADASFRNILEIPRITEYINSKQSEIATDNDIKLSDVVKELIEIKDIAKKTNKLTDAINALKEISKLSGLYELDNSQKQPQFNMPVTEWLNQK